MKFAFIILGDFDLERDRVSIHDGTAQIAGVTDIGEAVVLAQRLCREGIGCIELCGAFGPEGARKIVEATGGRIPVGYITHLPEQDDLYRAVFAK